MEEMRAVITQIELDDRIVSVCDGGEAMLFSELNANTFSVDANGEIYNCLIKNIRMRDYLYEDTTDRCIREVTRKYKDSNSLVRFASRNLPFLIFYKKKDSFNAFIPRYMEQIRDCISDGAYHNCFCMPDIGEFIPCEVALDKQDSKEILTIALDGKLISRTTFEWKNDTIADALKELYTETADDEINVTSSAEFIKTPSKPIVSSYGELLVDIYSGNQFDFEKRHLKDVIGSLQKQIDRITKSDNYVGRYAVVRGGGDPTEYGNLNHNKKQSEVYYKQIREIEDKQQTPYRYRVDIIRDNQVMPFYLGAEELKLGGNNNVYSIYDPEWKNYITYDSKNDEVNRTLVLRREFDIKKGILQKLKNLYVKETLDDSMDITASVDPVLLQILQAKREDHSVTDIIVTITEAQEKIVEEPYAQNIVVQGCAGSGKTMVMMHRLSRLQNWVKAFDPKEVMIITPSDQYAFYMRAVTEGLAIRNIQQYTLERYYENIIDELAKGFFNIGKIVSEYGVDSRIIEFVYSDEFITKFDVAYSNAMEKRKIAIEHVISLGNEFGIVGQTIADDEKTKDNICGRILNVCRDQISQSEEEIAKLNNRILLMEKRLEDLKITEIDKAQEEYQKSVRQAWNEAKILAKEYLNKHGNNNDLRRLINTNISQMDENQMLVLLYRVVMIIPEINESLNVCGQNSNRIMDLQEELETKPDAINKAKEELEQKKKISTDETLVKELDTVRDEYKSLSGSSLYRGMFDEAIRDLLEKNKLKKPSQLHRYDLYAMVLFCLKYVKDIKPITYSFICIDEGQDIALNEYRLIKKLNGIHARFNIYGDTNQLIMPGRGISDWAQLDDVVYGIKKPHELNVNYRNTTPIIEYCNGRFDLNVLDIGLNGPAVNMIGRKNLEADIKTRTSIGNERWAILVPRKKRKQKIYKKLSTVENTNILSCTNIGNGYIAVMYIDEVKGFEFDRVYYYDDNLSVNEEYIAATRGLSNLFVVK